MRTRGGSEKIIALVMIFVVIVVFASVAIPNLSTAGIRKLQVPDYLYTNPVTGSSIGFFDPLKYKDNSTRAIYEIPTALTSAVLPSSFTRQAQISGSTGQTNTGSTTQPPITGTSTNTTILQVNTNLVSHVNTTATAIAGNPVISVQQNPTAIYHTGDTIPVTGKISEINFSPPYHYNLLVTCCGMNSYYAQDHLLTEPDGTIYYNIQTSGSFPIGDWTVTVDTLDTNGKDLAYSWHFTLLQ